MNRKPYSSYHGRRTLGQRILIAVAVVLAVALALAVVAMFVLPNYMVYTADGLQFNLPLPGRDQGEQSAAPSDGGTDLDSEVVFDEPSNSPEPSPSPAPDLTDLPQRRTAPLGLVPYGEDVTLGSRQGFLFTAEQVSDFTRETCQEEYDYVAVYVDAAELEADELETRCLTLAGQGVDEIVVAGEVDVKALREALPADVYHGYLSAVAEKEPFLNNTQQGKDYAAYCDRVYVPGGSWNGLNLLSYLRGNGFVGTSADIVTRVAAPATSNWAWAVLPE